MRLPAMANMNRDVETRTQYLHHQHRGRRNQRCHERRSGNREGVGLSDESQGSFATALGTYLPLPIKLLNVQNSTAARPIDAGSVNTQAISKLRIVDICKPDLFAHIVPATPDDSTCVVLTGKPM